MSCGQQQCIYTAPLLFMGVNPPQNPLIYPTCASPYSQVTATSISYPALPYFDSFLPDFKDEIIGSDYNEEAHDDVEGIEAGVSLAGVEGGKRVFVGERLYWGAGRR